MGVAVDSSGNIYIADYYNSRIREVIAASDIIITFAGDGTSGFSGDSGPASSAELYQPTGASRPFHPWGLRSLEEIMQMKSS